MDPTGSKHQENRRAARKDDERGDGGHSREIELKRSRGEISCAECRRLKIKCDKKLPCSSCSRRGCAALCPNGSLSTGQGTRFVMAATDHLHRRVAKMSERIRQLEDALSIAHARNSSEEHPLLRKELLNVKTHKADVPPDGGDARGVENPDVIDAFGTLSITDRGTSRFFGAAGGTESLLHEDEDSGTSHHSPSNASANTPESMRESTSPPHEAELVRFSYSFPFTPMGSPESIRELIESHLPPWDRAVYLCETYLEHAGWVFRAVSRQQLMNEMLPSMYKRATSSSQPSLHDYWGPHDLAVVLMVFAVGALVDLCQEPYNSESEHFYILAKAAVMLQSVLDKPELSTIQALHLMSIFNAMSQNVSADADTSMELSWMLIRLCIQLSEVIGLHRDSARWGLAPKEVNRRRALFWDLFVAETWQSLATGRPPSITTPYIDCHFPVDDEAKLNAEGDTEPGYNSWGFRFACDCVAEVVARTFTAQIPAYSTILDIDRTIREFPMPEMPPMDVMPDPKKPSVVMVQAAMSHTKEVILLCLHRSFFAQAMIDDPVNPLRSQYAPSFLAAYRSATHILKTIQDQFQLQPELCSRFWITWTYAFSAAIVCGTVVTRGPSSEFAESALKELDQACELFSKASNHSRRAAKAFIILQRLQIKAHHSRTTFLNTKSSPEPDDAEDELSVFGGRTRLLSPKGSSQSPPASQSLSNSTPAIVIPPLPVESSPNVSMQSRGGSHTSMSSGVVSPSTGEHMMDTRWSASTPNANASGMHKSNSSSGTGTSSGYTPTQTHYPYDDRVFLHHISQPAGQRSGPSGTPNSSTSSMHGWTPPPPPASFVAGNHLQHQQPHHPSYQRSIHGDGYTSMSSPPHVVPSSFSHSHQSHPQYHSNSREPHGRESSSYAVFDSTGAPIHHQSLPPMHTPHMHASSSLPGTFPAVREFAEMGLVSQDSGVHQRWTSYMQDSGVFYPSNGGHPS